MRNELQRAVDFITDLLAKKTNVKKSEIFRQTLHRVLISHYQNHWFPEKPFKGSAYRCIRINHKMDPLIRQAGNNCGFTEKDLFAILPNEFTMWIDPREVSYRIGEEGSIGLIYEGSPEDNADPMPAPASPSSPSSSNNHHNNINQQETQHDNTQHGGQQAQQQQQQQYRQQHQLMQQQQQHSDFFRSCKDQLRYIMPDSSDAVTTMNLEYLSSFVAS